MSGLTKTYYVLASVTADLRWLTRNPWQDLRNPLVSSIVHDCRCFTYMPTTVDVIHVDASDVAM